MNCRFILSACLLLFCVSVFPQTSNIIKGDVCMEKADFAKAAAFYKKAADYNLNDMAAKEKLAKAFMALHDYQSAEAVYQVLAGSPMAGAVNKFYYAQVLRINGKYEVADIQYRTYAQEHPNDPLNEEFRNFLTNVQTLATVNQHYRLTNIPENSEFNDQGPATCLYTFCFTSDRPSAGKKESYDLYFLRGGDASNSAKPQKITGKINMRLDEGPATFSANGRQMIFTRSNYKHKGDDGITRLGLYQADYDSLTQKWMNVTQLPFINYNYNYMQPSLSKDGNRLFFASDIKGGAGETDIYVSEKHDSGWGTPVNLGSSINTTGKEGYPFIADDGTLYFASDSRMGLGGFDIYSAIATSSSWGRVINLGAPLNTAHNDFGYMADANGRSGYVVSDRPGGMGEDDIYHFTLNTNSVCDTLMDAKTRQPVQDAVVSLTADDSTGKKTTSNADGEFCFELESGSRVTVSVNKVGYGAYNGKVSASAEGSQIIYLKPQGVIELNVNVFEQGTKTLQNASAMLVDPATQQVIEQKAAEDGAVKFNIEPNREYVLKVEGTTATGGYEKFVRPISTIGLRSGQTMKEDAQLVYHENYASGANSVAAGKQDVNKSAAGTTTGNATNADVTLPNVYFGSGSYTLDAVAKKALDKIAGSMKALPGLEIEISSNTDATGNLKANMVLSARRALACLDYLTAKGINKGRFIAVGYGDRKLVNNCAKANHCTEAEQAMNRRTEFKIIKR